MSKTLTNTEDRNDHFLKLTNHKPYNFLGY